MGRRAPSSQKASKRPGRHRAVGEGGESCQVRRVGIPPFMKTCVGWATINYSNLLRTQARIALEKYQHDCPWIFCVLLMDEVLHDKGHASTIWPVSNQIIVYQDQYLQSRWRNTTKDLFQTLHLRYVYLVFDCLFFFFPFTCAHSVQHHYEDKRVLVWCFRKFGRQVTTITMDDDDNQFDELFEFFKKKTEYIYKSTY